MCDSTSPANDGVFAIEIYVQFRASRETEFARSGEYRKNGQVWIDQNKGAAIRRLVGYCRYAGPHVWSRLSASWGC